MTIEKYNAILKNAIENIKANETKNEAIKRFTNFLRQNGIRICPERHIKIMADIEELVLKSII